MRRGGSTPIDYMRARAGRLDDTGELERTILVLAAAGLSARALRRTRPRRASSSAAATATAPTPGGVELTAFSVLALEAAGPRLDGGASAPR